MSRRPRLKLAGIPLHIIHRAKNRSACFHADDDYRFYLEHLERLCEEERVFLHAFVLMTSHVHLLLTPETVDGASRLMKRLGQRYVQHINQSYQRSGTLWDGRFRSCPVDADAYLLGCQRYIELNPVRTGMVAHPGDYPWSSYRANAHGEVLVRLNPHPAYLQLGKDDASRREAYRELFLERMESTLVAEIRDATNSGFCLGNERFKTEVSRMLQRRVTPGKPGRPRKLETAAQE